MNDRDVEAILAIFIPPEAPAGLEAATRSAWQARTLRPSHAKSRRLLFAASAGVAATLLVFAGLLWKISTFSESFDRRETSAPGRQEIPKDLSDLVRSLGDEKVEVRARAQETLIKRAKNSTALQRALEDLLKTESDAEVVQRIGEVLAGAELAGLRFRLSPHFEIAQQIPKSAIPAAMSPDGRYVAVLEENLMLSLWSVGDKKLLRKGRLPSPQAALGPVGFGDISFTSDSTAIALHPADGIILYDVKSFERIRELRREKRSPRPQDDLRPGDNLWVYQDPAGFVVLSKLTGEEVSRTSQPLPGVAKFAFSPDGKVLFASAGAPGTPCVSLLLDGATLRTIVRDDSVGQFPPLDAGFSRDSRLLLTATVANELRLYGSRKLDLLAQVKPVPKSIFCGPMAQMADGRLVVGTTDKEVHLYAFVSRNRSLVELDRFEEGVFGAPLSISVSQDGRWVFLASIQPGPGLPERIRVFRVDSVPAD